MINPDLGDTEIGAFWRNYPTTRTPAPTLHSRAHPQDYGRRTTPSNQYDDDHDDDYNDDDDNDEDDAD